MNALRPILAASALLLWACEGRTEQQPVRWPPADEMRWCYAYTCNSYRGCCQDFRKTCDYGEGSPYDCAVVLRGVWP